MKSLNMLYLVKIWKTPGIIVGILFMIIFLPFFPSAQVGAVFGAPELQAEISFAIAGTIIGTAITISMMQSWGYIFANIETSDIKRRIGTSNISRAKYFAYAYLYAVMLFFVMVAISFTIFGIYDAAGLMNNTDDQSFNWGNAAWGNIIGGLFLLFFTSVTISLFFGKIFKDFAKYTTVSWIYILLTFLVGGASAPLYIIRDMGNSNVDVLLPFEIISYIVPSATNNIFLAGAFGSSHTGITEFSTTSFNLLNTLPQFGVMLGITGWAMYDEFMVKE